MITYLKVRNLAIVEEFELELGAGFNVLTGETGAGKSLLIDSLEFLCGGRSSSDSIRTGEEKLTAEAVMAIGAEVARELSARGLELDGAEELVVRREFAANGRGRASLNGDLVTVRELQQAMSRLVEIHGQHESHELIAGQSFRQIVDAFGNNGPSVAALRELHASWVSASEQLVKLTDAQRDRTLRLDLLRYQIQEISAAKLDPGEDESLRTERSILSNSQALAQSTSAALLLLEEDEEAVTTRIARAGQLLHGMAGSVETVGRLCTELDETRFRLQEIVRDLSRFAGEIRHDPERLDEIEERLAIIDRLKKKYGHSLEEVLAHLASITDEYEQLMDFESNLEKLQKREAEAFGRFFDSAEMLSSRRKKAAEQFQKAIQSELRDLAMEKTTVRVAVSTTRSDDSRLRIGDQGVAFGPEGFDRVEILIAPNRGEEPRPMQKIASGGELSRIQLAIAAALFKANETSAEATLVFDEIDAGVGGRVAEVVGKKLRELSAGNQVLCVTHLPQIAALGTTHFRVWKEEHRGRTRARIVKLDSREERVEELSRMLGGESVTESVRTHARELLDRSETHGRQKTTTRT